MDMIGGDAMNKQEFIKLEVSSGYGTKSAAERYAETHEKPEYTTDDLLSCTTRPCAGAAWRLIKDLDLFIT